MDAGGREKALGVGGRELHAHGEVVAVGAAVGEDAALASPKGEEEDGADGGEEEFGIDVPGLADAEVAGGLLSDLLDGGAGAGSGAEVDGAAEGGGVEGEAGDGGGDVVD